MGSGLFFRGAKGTDWTVSGSEPWVSVKPLGMALRVLGVSVVGRSPLVLASRQLPLWPP